MTDNYNFCPCGSGKKIKFCCCKNVVKELDKVQRALEGQQRAAALDQINQALAAKGPTSGLYVMRANVELELQQYAQAKETVDQLLANDARCSAGYALRGLIRHVLDESEDNEELTNAVADVQAALACTGEAVSMELFNVLGVIGEALLSEQRFCEALGHFMVQVTFGSEELPQGAQNYSSVMANLSVPLIRKSVAQQANAYASVAEGEAKELWTGVFAGRWNQVKASLVKSELAKTDDGALRVLATVEAFLGNIDASVLAWRELAGRLESPQEKLEALSLAQGLAPIELDVAVNEYSYVAVDSDKLSEFLRAHPQTIAQEINPEEYGEGEPPPLASFEILDRPAMKSVEDGELTPDSVPRMIGACSLYGKQTDRDARLLMHSHELNSDTVKNLLAEIAGDSLGALTDTNEVGRISTEFAKVRVDYRLPEDAKPDNYEQLQQNSFAPSFALSMSVPRGFLDGKSIEEVARQDPQDPEVLAAVLRFTSLGPPLETFAEKLNELNIELPAPTGVPGESHVPLIFQPHLDPAKLTDDQLLVGLRDAVNHRLTTATARLAPAVIERMGDELEDIDRVYESLISSVAAPSEQLVLVKQAQEAAKKRGESPAEWLFVELNLHLQRGNGEQAMKLVQQLQANHMEEPGVGQRLFQILYQLGIVGPDGQMVNYETADESGGIITSDSTGTESGQLWTGDDTAVASSDDGGGEEKGGLWLPGMD